MYRARGRISRPSAVCSNACAIHPTTRPTANNVNAAPAGKPSTRSMAASAKSTVGAAPVARQILSQWFFGNKGPYTAGSSQTL